MVLLSLLTGCGRDDSGPDIQQLSLPAAEDLSKFQNQYFGSILWALTIGLDNNGQVADLRPTGGWDDQGDGGIFTGLLLGSLDCVSGASVLATVLKSISDNKGMIPSHNPLIPTKTITSRDQETGVMFGLVERWRRCPDDRAAIAAAWSKQVAYVDTNNGNIGPTADGAMLSLHWLWGAVGQYFGAGGGGGSKQEFEAGLVTTIAGINAEHSACYPAHTGTLQAIIAAKIGQPISSTTHGLFCLGARGLELGLTDWYCGLGHAADWLASYQPNVWIYKHQRCPNWEGPDAGGDQSPRVDYLDLYELAAEGQH